MEEDFNLTKEKDKQGHNMERNGDHFVIPLQCNLYHFCNLTHMNYRNSTEDLCLIVCIRKANIYVFWSRESSIVAATKIDGVRIWKVGKPLVLDKFFL